MKLRACLLLAAWLPGLAIAQDQNAPEHFNPALQLMLCRVIKDDGARLKCFDGAIEALARPSSKASAESLETEKQWRIEENKSPIDDSAQVVALLLSDAPASGALIFRCKERKVEGYFAPEKYLGSSSSNVKAIYRIDNNKPVEVRWSGSSEGRAAFFNNAAGFMETLPDDGKLFIRAYDFRGVPVDATFSLAKVSEPRARVFAACAASTHPKKK